MWRGMTTRFAWRPGLEDAWRAADSKIKYAAGSSIDFAGGNISVSDYISVLSLPVILWSIDVTVGEDFGVIL
jgi:hypothetical protein